MVRSGVATSSNIVAPMLGVECSKDTPGDGKTDGVRNILQESLHGQRRRHARLKSSDSGKNTEVHPLRQNSAENKDFPQLPLWNRGVQCQLVTQVRRGP